MNLRLADLIASLSLVTDLGMGHPPEQALESCLVATSLARDMNLAVEEIRDIYYTTLLFHVGCSASAHEGALYFGGDDIGFREASSLIDVGNPREVFTGFLPHIAKGASPFSRAWHIARFVARSRTLGPDLSRATCEVAAHMARRMGFDRPIQRALYEMFERWDGTGVPQQISEDELSLPIRFAMLASQVVVFHRAGGAELALAVIHQRAGSMLDPFIADAFASCGQQLLREIDAVDAWDAVLAAEPGPRRYSNESELDDIARAFGDAVDLKCPFMHGHSAGVAELAEAAGESLGFDRSTSTTLRWAGLFHDLGRFGVPNEIWEKPGPLTTGEWSR